MTCPSTFVTATTRSFSSRTYVSAARPRGSVIATTFSCLSCSTPKRLLVTPPMTRPAWIGMPSVHLYTSSRPRASTCRVTRRPLPSQEKVSEVPSKFVTESGFPRQLFATDIVRVAPPGPGIAKELARPSASYPNSTAGSPVSSTRTTYPAAFRVKSACPPSGSNTTAGRSFSSSTMRDMFR